MSPFEHGECFVLDDGGECDLDLGNYERFIGNRLTRDHNITTGKVYQSVIQKVKPNLSQSQERAGAYLGKTVQVVPHIVNEIQERIARVSRVPVEEGLSPQFFPGIFLHQSFVNQPFPFPTLFLGIDKTRNRPGT